MDPPTLATLFAKPLQTLCQYKYYLYLRLRAASDFFLRLTEGFS